VLCVSVLYLHLSKISTVSFATRGLQLAPGIKFVTDSFQIIDGRLRSTFASSCANDRPLVQALSLIRNERKPFEEMSESSDDISDTKESDSSDTNVYEQKEKEDSPWEISSNSSDSEQVAPPSGSKAREVPQGSQGAEILAAGAPCPSKMAVLGRKPTMEMPRIFQSINFTITCLYKLPIRQPAPLDRLKHKTSIDASSYQHFDVLYVMDKFPQLGMDVATRLGKMISRRRQILYYRASHDKSLDTAPVEQKKIATTKPTANILSTDTAISGSEPGHGSQAGHSQAVSSQFALQSKATTLRLNNPPEEEGLDFLAAPSVVESKSSIASSYAGKDLQVEVPPRPRGEHGKELDYFERPYCMVTKVVTTGHQWK
jgi:hypothetical protein